MTCQCLVYWLFGSSSDEAIDTLKPDVDVLFKNKEMIQDKLSDTSIGQLDSCWDVKQLHYDEQIIPQQ